uniref:Secreted protein n=1 Tax=Parastrongyloides trichosuri TaxID=131310 RepID=A0A0N4ZM29_PARTI
MFSQKLFVFLILSLALHQGDSCSSGSAGSKTYQSPTIQMKFLTPVKWTYPLSTSEADLSYFPEQPLTQSTAQNNANNDITNAMTQALVENNLNINLYTITAIYSSPQVNDCAKSSTSTNAPIIFWLVEGGVVTKKVGGLTQAVSGANCISKTFGTSVTYEDYPQEATVRVEGLTVGEEQMNQIKNAFLTKLTFSASVKFLEDPTVM